MDQIEEGSNFKDWSKMDYKDFIILYEKLYNTKKDIDEFMTSKQAKLIFENFIKIF